MAVRLARRAFGPRSRDFRLWFDRDRSDNSEKVRIGGGTVKKAKGELGGEGAGTDRVPADAAGPGGAEAPRRGSAQERGVDAEGVQLGRRLDAPVRRSPGTGKYDQLWQLSMADPHTGLANQLLLLDRLTQALTRRRRHGGEVVVCHIDLDNLARDQPRPRVHHGEHRPVRDVPPSGVGPAQRGHGGPGGRERARGRAHRHRRAGGRAAHAPDTAHARRAGHGGRERASASTPRWASRSRRTPSPPRTSWRERIARRASPSAEPQGPLDRSPGNGRDRVRSPAPDASHVMGVGGERDREYRP